MIRDVRYWQTYYTIQEQLASDIDYVNSLSATPDGGIRCQSTLPKQLNRLAHSICERLLIEKMKPYEVSCKEFNNYLDKLEYDLRAFLDECIISDHYFLVKSNNEVVAGFTVNLDGTMSGLFCSNRGIGKEVIDIRIRKSIELASNGVKSLNLFCIGEHVKSLYIGRGFKITKEIEFDDDLIDVNWNYAKFGRPNLFEMELELMNPRSIKK